jgi:hypothetical protein
VAAGTPPAVVVLNHSEILGVVLVSGMVFDGGVR